MEWVFIIVVGLFIFYRKRIARVLNLIGEYIELKVTDFLIDRMYKDE